MLAVTDRGLALAAVASAHRLGSNVERTRRGERLERRRRERRSCRGQQRRAARDHGATHPRLCLEPLWRQARLQELSVRLSPRLHLLESLSIPSRFPLDSLSIPSRFPLDSLSLPLAPSRSLSLPLARFRSAAVHASASGAGPLGPAPSAASIPSAAALSQHPPPSTISRHPPPSTAERAVPSAPCRTHACRWTLDFLLGKKVPHAIIDLSVHPEMRSRIEAMLPGAPTAADASAAPPLTSRSSVDDAVTSGLPVVDVGGLRTFSHYEMQDLEDHGELDPLLSQAIKAYAGVCCAKAKAAT